MKVVVVGSGYVGLVSGACLAEFGHFVTCVDKDAAKIAMLEAGKIPIYEPGLDTLVAANAAAGRLAFSTALDTAVPEADIVMIAVGTPSRRGDGFADLSFVYEVARSVAPQLAGYTVVVTKSTVPVGTSREVGRIIAEANPQADFDVASNPEFLREGSAIEDFQRPDRVVVGASSPRAQAVMKELYRPLYLNETPMVMTTPETSELTKYAANAFLAMKITFINQIADLCEKTGADVQMVAKGIGLDGRIGSKFLNAGPGYGGSCFPKDTLALARQAREFGTPMSLVETVIESNDARKKGLAARIVARLGGLEGRRIAILGLTFKPNTDDMRDSPSLDLVPALLSGGSAVVGHDPQGAAEAAQLMPGLEIASTPYEAATNADALVILTEWNEYRALDLGRIAAAMKGKVLFDFRNIYKAEEVTRHGLGHVSIGRPLPD